MLKTETRGSFSCNPKINAMMQKSNDMLYTFLGFLFPNSAIFIKIHTELYPKINGVKTIKVLNPEAIINDIGAGKL